MSVCLSGRSDFLSASLSTKLIGSFSRHKSLGSFAARRETKTLRHSGPNVQCWFESLQVKKTRRLEFKAPKWLRITALESAESPRDTEVRLLRRSCDALTGETDQEMTSSELINLKNYELKFLKSFLS